MCCLELSLLVKALLWTFHGIVLNKGSHLHFIRLSVLCLMHCCVICRAPTAASISPSQNKPNLGAKNLSAAASTISSAISSQSRYTFASLPHVLNMFPYLFTVHATGHCTQTTFLINGWNTKVLCNSYVSCSL